MAQVPPTSPAVTIAFDPERPPKGWPLPVEVSHYLKAAIESRRGGSAIAMCTYVQDLHGLGPSYDLALVHGGALDTTLALGRLRHPRALWAALEDIAAACPDGTEAPDEGPPSSGERGWGRGGTGVFLNPLASPKWAG